MGNGLGVTKRTDSEPSCNGCICLPKQPRPNNRVYPEEQPTKSGKAAVLHPETETQLLESPAAEEPCPSGTGQASAHAGRPTVSFAPETSELKDSAFFVIRKTEDVHSKYDIIGQQLGHGQFGVVYAAVEQSTGKRYAVKTMSKRKARENPDFSKDTRSEVEILYLLVGHPNVVQLYEVYEDKDAIHLVLELCEGGDWFGRLIKDGTYSEAQAAATVRIILKALAYCHSLGVVHRDLKPKNMLYTDHSEDAAIKLADFGLAALMPKTALQGAGWYRSDKEGLLNDTVGTPYYVAPEVLEGCGYGREVDIWSMGVVVFIALGGYPPFSGSNQQQVFYGIKYKPLVFENATWEHISDHAKDLIRRMLTKDPAKRASIPELLAHPWLAGASHCGSMPTARVPVPDAVVTRLHQFASLNRFKKEARKVLASLLPQEEIVGLLSIFREMDTNGDGILSLPELVGALKLKGINMPDAEAKMMMHCADINEDGNLDYEEFLAATVHQMRLNKEDLLMKAFQQFDVQGHGLITADELRHVLVSHGEKVDVDALLKEIDTNHDGGISYEEFCICMRKKQESGVSFGQLIKVTMKEAAEKLRALRVNDPAEPHRPKTEDEVVRQMFGSRAASRLGLVPPRKIAAAGLGETEPEGVGVGAGVPQGRTSTVSFKA